MEEEGGGDERSDEEGGTLHERLHAGQSDADGAPSGVVEGRTATGNGAKSSAIAEGTLPVVIRSPGRGVGHGRVTARLRIFSEKGLAGPDGFS